MGWDVQLDLKKQIEKIGIEGKLWEGNRRTYRKKNRNENEVSTILN